MTFWSLDVNVRCDALRGQPNTRPPTTNLAALRREKRFIRFKQVALACPIIEPFDSFDKTKAFHIFSNTHAEQKIRFAVIFRPRVFRKF